mmetsp:Transcript_32244/g.126100  ORF Transcript_32244/g.126100 Transcript_32244/m.126100 type:complete len:230 (+) Transcript_32244:2552-3241(+)
MNSSLLRVFDFFLSPFFSSSRSESLWTFATALKSATAPCGDKKRERVQHCARMRSREGERRRTGTQRTVKPTLVAILLRRRSFSISVAASGITLAFSANFNLSDRLITSSLTFCFSRFLISFRRFKCFPSGSSIPSDPSFSPGARDKIFPSALPKCSTSALSISKTETRRTLGSTRSPLHPLKSKHRKNQLVKRTGFSSPQEARDGLLIPVEGTASKPLARETAATRTQ